jgi:hypothetical protein
MDEQLRASCEQAGQRRCALLGVEPVWLVDPYPGQPELVLSPGASLAICAGTGAGGGALIVSLILFTGAGQQLDSLLLLFMVLGASAAAGTAAAATAAARRTRGPDDPLALTLALRKPRVLQCLAAGPLTGGAAALMIPLLTASWVGPYRDGRDDRRVGAFPCRRACARPAHRQHRGLEHRKSAATSAAAQAATRAATRRLPVGRGFREDLTGSPATASGRELTQAAA